MAVTTNKTPLYNSSLKADKTGMYKDGTGAMINQGRMDKANKTFNHWAGALGKLQVGTERYDNVAKRLQRVGQQYGYDTSKILPKGWQVGYKPEQTNTTTNTGTTTANTGTPGGMQVQSQSYQSPMTGALMKALQGNVNTLDAYEPKTFEGSPMYQFQKQKGLKDMERLMAARGLTNSGAEIEANQNFLTELNATEAEKQRGYAENRMNRQSDMMRFIAGFDQSERRNYQDQLNANLDRGINMSQFEATRMDAATRAKQNMLMQLLGIQAQNPIPGIATQGDQKLTDYSAQLRESIARALAQGIPRAVGGSGTPPPATPYNLGQLDINAILAGNAAGNDRNDLGSFLGNLFGF